MRHVPAILENYWDIWPALNCHHSNSIDDPWYKLRRNKSLYRWKEHLKIAKFGGKIFYNAENMDLEVSRL